MSLPHAVLGVLEARQMTGYELTQFFESTARWVWAAPQSQIYPLLRKMEGEGLISGEEQLRGSRLKRTSYSITDAGLAELHGWLRVSHSEPSVRDALLLQALFFDMIAAAEAEAVLRERVAEVQDKVEQWSVHRARLLAGDAPLLRERLARRDPADHDRIKRLKAHVFDYLIEAGQVRIRWALEAIDILQAGTEPTIAEPG
jgi:DNA-binding PadR family transcriptional regulator